VKSFFTVRDWATFIPKGSEATWQKWQNFKEFSFDIGFMEPFASLDPLRESIYECCAKVLGPRVADVMDPFRFKRSTSADQPDSEGPLTLVECEHDIFDGIVYLSEKRSRFGFRKRSTTLEALVESVPVWMEVMHAILRSAVFVRLVGSDYSRLLFSRFGFEQIIHLEGEGVDREPVQNSQLMGHFLRFGLSDDSPVSPTIEKLGFESLGRSDVKFSFKRNIGSTPYLIWFTAKAPLNQKGSIIHIEWDIQDLKPERILDKRYGDIMDNFLRLTVFGEFYRTWFKNINCHSLL